MVLTIFLSVIMAKIEALQHVLCIHYPVLLKQKLVYTFIDFDSEVNAMTPSYAKKLGLRV